MTLNISVDIEADGPVPGLYSMVSFGAVVVEEGFKKTFYGELSPISQDWIDEALNVSGFSREQTEEFTDPKFVMHSFDLWLKHLGDERLIFWADNNGFDWQFINYYLHRFVGNNRFGFSSQNINSFYKGLHGNVRASFKHLRTVRHTHNALDDAMGNAGALLKMQEQYGIPIINVK